MKTIFFQYKYIPVSIAQCFGRGMFLNEMKNSGTLIITLVIIIFFQALWMLSNDPIDFVSGIVGKLSSP